MNRIVLDLCGGAGRPPSLSRVMQTYLWRFVMANPIEQLAALKEAIVAVVEHAEESGECRQCGAEVCRGSPHETDPPCRIGVLKRAALGVSVSRVSEAPGEFSDPEHPTFHQCGRRLVEGAVADCSLCGPIPAGDGALKQRETILGETNYYVEGESPAEGKSELPGE